MKGIKKFLGRLWCFYYSEHYGTIEIEWDKLFMGFLMGVFGLIILLFLLVFVVYVPTAIKAEHDCLEKGYPSASISYKLEAYCISPFNNLDESRSKVLKLNPSIE